MSGGTEVPASGSLLLRAHADQVRTRRCSSPMVAMSAAVASAVVGGPLRPIERAVRPEIETGARRLLFRRDLIGERGPHVKELQKKLIALGYPLPRWGPDGVLGDETIRAALDCMTFGWPDVFFPEYMPDFDGTFVEQLAGLPDQWVQAIMEEPLPTRPDWLIDETERHPVRNAYKTPRKLTDITAIVLHQTACHLGERPGRWHSVPAHIGVTRKGKVILINRLQTVCWHANYFNRFSVGIEIDGNFRGIESKPGTLWKGGGRRSRLSAEHVEASRRAVDWICQEVANGGGRVETILAHRQTSKNRRADPGQAIWKTCGLWAQVPPQNLNNDPDYVKGSGLPIPKEWDPRSEHEY